MLFRSNAGLPVMEDGVPHYRLSPEDFAGFMAEIARRGAAGVGGCCGTFPEHMAAMIERLKDFAPLPREKKPEYLSGPRQVLALTAEALAEGIPAGEDEEPIILIKGGPEAVADALAEGLAGPAALYSPDPAELAGMLAAFPGRALAGPVTEENAAALRSLARRYGCLLFSEGEGAAYRLREGKIRGVRN